jgi:hypothetical protein
MFVPAGDRAADGVPAEYQGKALIAARWLLPLAAVASLARPAAAVESCTYAGTTSYDGQVSVQTIASGATNDRTVDVLARVRARSFGLLPWRYWAEEIGTWRDGAMTRVAVNNRYEFSGRILRQNWDVFTASEKGLMARRVQGKTEADFERQHPGFVSHWDPSSFGVPWLPDYPKAPPERRADLDLPKAEVAPGLGSPLALAFYWVRWAPPETRPVPIFLPGFKHDARVDVSVSYLGTEGDGSRHFRTAVRHPQLSEDQTSTGDAWVTADHRLARVAFDARGARGTAHGELQLDGCDGSP